MSAVTENMGIATWLVNFVDSTGSEPVYALAYVDAVSSEAALDEVASWDVTPVALLVHDVSDPAARAAYEEHDAPIWEAIVAAG